MLFHSSIIPSAGLLSFIKISWGAYSLPNDGAAQTSPLLAWLSKDKLHHDLALDDAARRRLMLWLDLYGQRQGAFSPAQEEELKLLRTKMADLLVQGSAAQ